jgi:hypothetical protein
MIFANVLLLASGLRAQLCLHYNAEQQITLRLKALSLYTNYSNSLTRYLPSDDVSGACPRRRQPRGRFAAVYRSSARHAIDL